MEPAPSAPEQPIAQAEEQKPGEVKIAEGAGGREPCLHFAVMAHEFRLRGLGKLQHSCIE
jgi:hypothetical protein